MDEELTIEDLEKILTELSMNERSKDRNFKFRTGSQGMKSFNEAIEVNTLKAWIKDSKFNNEQKENLNRLVDSKLREDRVLVKEILGYNNVKR